MRENAGKTRTRITPNTDTLYAVRYKVKRRKQKGNKEQKTKRIKTVGVREKLENSDV